VKLSFYWLIMYPTIDWNLKPTPGRAGGNADALSAADIRNRSDWKKT
jgi:hypothetical protein